MAKPAKVHILGRAWIFDDDPSDFFIWEHEFEPMEPGPRSGHDWCMEHFRECYSEADIRKLFGLPDEGNFQVLFKGTMAGRFDRSFEHGDEWDEEFTVEECSHKPIPEKYMDGMLADE